MGTIKALLVGVCEYLTIKCHPLPLCKNDLFAMRTALIKGLNVGIDNTLLFYFSGHGGKNCLVLSDGLIELQDLINTIEQIQTKNKIVILDSCHPGGFALDTVPTIDIDETIEHLGTHTYKTFLYNT